MVTIKISISRLVRICKEDATYTFNSPLGENLRIVPAPNSWARCNVVNMAGDVVLNQAASRTIEIFD